MPVLPAKDGFTWHYRSPKERVLRALAWLATLALLALCWQFISAQTFWVFVQDAPEQAADLLQRMFPPRWSYLNELWLPLWDTLTIATLGTLIAIILATPIAFLAARNTTPHAIFRGASLLVIVSSRSVHSLIWSLLLVFLLGPGVFAGVIAIGCARLVSLPNCSTKPLKKSTPAK